jgi:tetratricopeptide (TPR) repeat protein
MRLLVVFLLLSACVTHPAPQQVAVAPANLEVRPVPDLTAVEKAYKEDRYAWIAQTFAVGENKLLHRATIDDHWTWQYVGYAYLKTGDHARAASAFRRVMELKPKFSPAIYNLACVAALGGNQEESLEILQLLASRVRPFQSLKRKYREMLMSDEDLTNIRTHERYPSTVALFQ